MNSLDKQELRVENRVSGLNLSANWLIIMGVLMLVLGTLMMFYLFSATLVSVLFLGAAFIVGAISQLFQLVKNKYSDMKIYWIVTAVMYLIAGIMIMVNPLLSTVILTLLAALALLVAGAIRLWYGIQIHKRTDGKWLILSSIVTLLLGVTILVGWPADSLYILGLFLAIQFVFEGWAYFALGLLLKRGASPSA